MQTSIKHSLRRGAWLVIAAQGISQVVAFAALAVLYRRLGTDPYGLIGMVIPCLLLVRIFSTAGLDLAIIQHEELDDRQISQLFWLNQILGVTMALFTAALAPVLVWIYHEPRLGWLTITLAGTSIALSLGTSHQALLQRKLRFGALAMVRLVALVLASAAAIVAALYGWGVWSLVVQQYVELLVLIAMVWGLEPWRPSFTWHDVSIRQLVRFGGHCTVSSITGYLTVNFDKVLIGVCFGAPALGLYSQAFNLMMKPVHIVITPLTGIMLPTLSRSLSDRREFNGLLLGFFRFIALVMLPAGVGLMLVAPEVFHLLGGGQWANAGPLLAVLSAAILVQGFYNAMGSVFASVGRADRLARIALINTVILCSAFVVGWQVGGFLGSRTGDYVQTSLICIAASYSLAMLFVVFPTYLWICLRTIGISVGEWLAQLRVAVPAALGMGVVVLLGRLSLGFLPLPIFLTLEILLGVVVYMVLARRDIAYFLSQGFGTPSESGK